MFARMFVAAALLLGTGVAFASDASYDQQQIQKEAVSLVEGGLRPAAATHAEAAPPSMHAGHAAHATQCSCKM